MDFVKRPVACITISFFISFCVFARYSNFINTAVIFCSAFLFAGFTAVGFLAKKQRHSAFLRELALIFAGIFLSLLLAGKVFVSDISEYEKYEGKTEQVSGVITEVCYKENGYGTYIYEIYGKKMTAVLECDADLEVGDVADVKAEFKSLKSSESFDEKRYYMSKGAVIKACADSAEAARRDYRSVKIKAARINERFYSVLTERLNENVSGVIGAVLLGNKSELDNRIKRDFSRIGISHLIAISGMHVSYIYTAFSFPAGKAGVGKKTRSVLVTLILIFFVFLTGFSPSVTRAVLLTCLGSAAIILGVSYDGITAVGICACIMILINPRIALDISMQMSFCSYIGCLAANNINKSLQKPFDGKRKLLVNFYNRVVSSMLFTVIVVIFTMPVLWLYFDSVSIIAPLSNLIFIPMFSLILYLGILILIFSPITPIYTVLSCAAEKYISFILDISEKISSHDNITVSLNYSFAPYIIIAASAAIVFISCVKMKKAKIAGTVALLLCVVFYAAGASYCNSNLAKTTSVLRTGNASSDALLAVSGGKALICDISSSAQSSCDEALYEMKKLCITEPEAILFTDYGKAQIRAAERLADKYIVHKVYLAYPSENDTAFYLETINILKNEKIDIIRLPSKTDSFNFENIKITVSENQYTENRSVPSASFSIETNSSKLLYIGSAWNKGGGNAVSELGTDKNTVLLVGAHCTSAEDFISLSERFMSKGIVFFGKINGEAADLTGKHENIRKMNPYGNFEIILK